MRENAAEYCSSASEPRKDAHRSDEPRAPKGFMREWCSFVSLYKDSYISGPNRFEVRGSRSGAGLRKF